MNANPNSYPWPLRVVLATTIAGSLAIAAFGQPVGTPVPKTERIDKVEALVEAGQLNMVDAVKMAEQRTKGVAFQARCVVRPGPFAPGEGEPATGDVDAERLVYDIVCAINGKPLTVTIDGKQKKILTPKTPEPEPKPDPTPEPKAE